MPEKKVLIHADGVKKYFPSSEGFKTKYVKAVDNVSLDVYKGETLGLVGESGCGKSTFGRCLLRLFDITGGTIEFNGKDIYAMSPNDLIKERRNMQLIFQDPLASLNPRLRIRQIVEEPLHFHKEQLDFDINDKAKVREVVDKTLRDVGLDPDLCADRYPHEFSGGQQQRVGIARALILKPDFIVCDEAVSALDVSVQAQVLNLLEELKKEYDLTYLFISHNLSVIKHVCDRIAVMYLGQVVELADRDVLFSNPQHPYTKALISAIPIPDPEKKRNRILLEGDIPSPMNPPSGCRFHTRCYECGENCGCSEPSMIEVEPGHFVACHKFDK
ncbi:MAG: ATP-binding cassette domain-containing protein [Lachnospiraceae bacterium]|nr:ATP-binding cassette domain-containing protein [Lachnospiraceae bacterium]